MKIIRSGKASIEIELDDEFGNITIEAYGEAINDCEGVCIVHNSIKQIKPFEKELSNSLQINIAKAILKWSTDGKPMDTLKSIEFYDDLNEPFLSVDIPQKIYIDEIKYCKIIMLNIYSTNWKELRKLQEGFSYNPVLKQPINEWFGNEYIVIGVANGMGDPIIAKIDDEKLPIFTCMHDGIWELEQITDSFDNLIKAIDIVNKAESACDDLRKNDELRISAYNEIIKANPNSSNGYWEVFLKDNN